MIPSNQTRSLSSQFKEISSSPIKSKRERIEKKEWKEIPSPKRKSKIRRLNPEFLTAKPAEPSNLAINPPSVCCELGDHFDKSSLRHFYLDLLWMEMKRQMKQQPDKIVCKAKILIPEQLRSSLFLGDAKKITFKTEEELSGLFPISTKQLTSNSERSNVAKVLPPINLVGSTDRKMPALTVEFPYSIYLHDFSALVYKNPTATHPEATQVKSIAGGDGSRGPAGEL
eukprot:TRINITY_DN3085_c0_g1_i11.p2 TRINITY_DN3085_c0_g1~~TRINITY_DN3085_c0_g1_i11.p2  ORF type:complete len:227 (-),score=17.45 TRINITY_DN3085_c0_g1_i11:1617-2297(-)